MLFTSFGFINNCLSAFLATMSSSIFSFYALDELLDSSVSLRVDSGSGRSNATSATTGLGESPAVSVFGAPPSNKNFLCGFQMHPAPIASVLVEVATPSFALNLRSVTSWHIHGSLSLKRTWVISRNRM